MAAPGARAAPPHEDVTLPVGGETLPAAARDLCTRLLPGWAALAPADVAVAVISGGITNSLLKARPPTQRAPRAVLTPARQVTPPAASGLGAVVLRVFGTNTDIFIDRERELQARSAPPATVVDAVRR